MPRKWEISVQNLLGVTVLQTQSGTEPTYKFNMGNVAPGTYIVLIKNVENNDCYQEKILVH